MTLLTSLTNTAIDAPSLTFCYLQISPQAYVLLFNVSLGNFTISAVRVIHYREVRTEGPDAVDHIDESLRRLCGTLALKMFKTAYVPTASDNALLLMGRCPVFRSDYYLDLVDMYHGRNLNSAPRLTNSRLKSVKYIR